MHGFRAWVASGFLALGGCSDTDQEPETLAEGRAIFCSGFCDSGRGCGAADASCNRDYQPQGLRPGVLGNIGRCMKALRACESWEGEDPSRPCFEEVSKTTAPSSTVIDYCESASLHYFECSAWWGVDECLDSVVLWSDQVLHEAQSCHQHACQGLFDCETAVFEKY